MLKLLHLARSATSRRRGTGPGVVQDTATMNVWLHKQVLRKLAENGGKVPAELLD